MPHGGIPETIEARRAQILERQSTQTPTTATALGRSQRIGPRRAACVCGKAEGPFHPKGPAGGWCETGPGELWIFLPRNRIICQVENSLYLDRGSMNAPSTEPHREIRRAAGRAPSEAAECGPAASKMRPKRGG